MRYALTAAATVALPLAMSAQPQGLVETRAAMSAAISAQDKAAYARFLSDDLTSIDTAGRLRDKAAAVEDMPTGNAQVTLAVANMRLHSPDSVEFWRTVIFVNEGGRWRQAANMSTPITGAARSAQQ